jgi:hypothetical protein
MLTFEYRVCPDVRAQGLGCDFLKFSEKLISPSPWYETDHIENDTSNSSSIVECVLVSAVTFLLSRYLATI